MRRGAIYDAHDVGFLHDQQVFAVDLDFGPRPFAEQHGVTGFDIKRDEIALFIAGAGADGDNFAFHRFFLGAVRNDDASGGFFIAVQAAHNDAVMKRPKLHSIPSI